MSPRVAKFDRFMVDNENGRNLKLMRLSDQEFRALVSGVWAIASKATVRGSFMIGALPATADDVVHQSPKTSIKTAKTLLEKLRQMEMLEYDELLGGEWIHDWDDLNPTPRNDPSNAERQARFRARNAQSNAPSNGTSNAPSNDDVTQDENASNGLARASAIAGARSPEGKEVEVEEEEKEAPPRPPRGATPAPDGFDDWLADHIAQTSHEPPARTTKAFAEIVAAYRARRAEGHTAQDLLDATFAAVNDDYRRRAGYDTALSVLRPKKVGELVTRGRSLRRASVADDTGQFLAKLRGNR